jgi:NAD-dependent DNA ligase
MTKRRGITGQRTYAERTISRLQGILSGIAADKKMNNLEIAGLYRWLNENEFLREQYPFHELTDMIDEVLSDGIIDEDERDDLLTWCRDYTDANSLLKTVETEAARQLHGFLHGIVIDNKVNDQEVYGLREWLQAFSEYKTIWPFSEIWNLLEAILADGIVDEEERQYLIDFCMEFSERPIDAAVIHDDIYKKRFMKNNAPILKPVTALCDQVTKIAFESNTFCLTGPAKAGKRGEIEHSIERAGGTIRPRVDKSLNYLVIGANSSPCWVYSTYGRKIEQAMQLRQNGNQPLILYEDTFIPLLQTALQI